jgi:hypothetical protein
MVMDWNFDNTANEIMLSVDDTGIGGQFDSTAPLYFGNVLPMVRLVYTDMGQIGVQLAADNATKRHAALSSPNEERSIRRAVRTKTVSLP